MTRFEFGKNWQQFLAALTEPQILEAENALKSMLSVESFAGKTLLDIGAGSGLHSLAARRARRLVRFRSAGGRVRQLAEIPLFPARSGVDGRARLGAERAISGGVGNVRCRLFVGCAAPYRADVEGA